MKPQIPIWHQPKSLASRLPPWRYLLPILLYALVMYAIKLRIDWVQR